MPFELVPCELEPLCVPGVFNLSAIEASSFVSRSPGAALAIARALRVAGFQAIREPIVSGLGFERKRAKRANGK